MTTPIEILLPVFHNTSKYNTPKRPCSVFYTIEISMTPLKSPCFEFDKSQYDKPEQTLLFAHQEAIG